MKKQTLLLADNDETARQLLHTCISRLPYSFVLRECRNGQEAVRSINALQPDLILMDVMLPGKNGFEVLDQLDYMPPVIMMSASPEHAARAFDYQVVDYILKPLCSMRLQRAFRSLEERGSIARKKNDDRTTTAGYPTRIFVEKGNRLAGVPVNKIVYLKADRDYTWIHTLNGESYLCTAGIGELENKFDPGRFIRVHRSYMVNIDYIGELYRDISKLFISLPGNVEISVGRSYLPAIREFMF